MHFIPYRVALEFIVYRESPMGWSFRKSVNLGPLRVNLSKTGVGSSWGIPGFRVGVAADGRKYLRIGLLPITWTSIVLQKIHSFALLTNG